MTSKFTKRRGNNMSSSSVDSQTMKLEVLVIPVADVDRAKGFYATLGWRLDADFVTSKDFRVVQLTPPGSECSIIIGNGITSAVPGSVQGLHLVVFDSVPSPAASHLQPLRFIPAPRVLLMPSRVYWQRNLLPDRFASTRLTQAASKPRVQSVQATSALTSRRSSPHKRRLVASDNLETLPRSPFSWHQTTLVGSRAKSCSRVAVCVNSPAWIQ